MSDFESQQLEENYSSEAQVKLKKEFTKDLREKLYEEGFEYIGQLEQNDIYFIEEGGRLDKKNLRVRKCGNETMVTVKKSEEVGPIRKRRKISFGLKTEKEIEKYKDKYDTHKKVATVQKMRKVFKSTGSEKVIINIDEVRGLGQYVEIKVEESENSGEIINSTMKKLGLSDDEKVKNTYAELVLLEKSNTPGEHLIKIFEGLSEKIGEVMFGLSSGVVTTLGFVVGLGIGLKSTETVLASILIMAFADSLSDSGGIYTEKKMEFFSEKEEAKRTFLLNFFSKAGIILLFVPPFIFLQLNTAILLSVIMAIVILIFLSIEIASVQRGGYVKTIAFHLALFLGISLISLGIGRLIKVFLGTAFGA